MTELKDKIRYILADNCFDGTYTKRTGEYTGDGLDIEDAVMDLYDLFLVAAKEKIDAGSNIVGAEYKPVVIFTDREGNEEIRDVLHHREQTTKEEGDE